MSFDVGCSDEGYPGLQAQLARERQAYEEANAMPTPKDTAVFFELVKVYAGSDSDIRMESGVLPEESGSPTGRGTFRHPSRPNEVVMVYRDGAVVVSESFVRECADGVLTEDDFTKYMGGDDWREDETMEPWTPAGLLYEWLKDMFNSNFAPGEYAI